MFSLASLPGGCGVADGAVLAETAWCGPSSFQRMFSLLLKDLISDFYYSYNSVKSRCSR